MVRECTGEAAPSDVIGMTSSLPAVSILDTGSVRLLDMIDTERIISDEGGEMRCIEFDDEIWEREVSYML